MINSNLAPEVTHTTLQAAQHMKYKLEDIHCADDKKSHQMARRARIYFAKLTQNTTILYIFQKICKFF